MYDQELLSKIAAGEAGALSQLYDRYAKLIFGVALAILHETDDAEDVVQEVFVQVWKKAKLYQPALGGVKNWLVRIGHNRAINMLRSRRNRERQMEVSIPEDGELSAAMKVSPEYGQGFADENPWLATSRKEESAGIASALGSLPEDQRVLLDLAFFQGYSHSEIAELMAIPLGTVKTRIRSGIQSLRGQLKFMKDEAY